MEIEFICLANSYKLGGRCVAGLKTDGGGWIRPVPADSTTTLLSVHYQLASWGEPQVLDVIRLGLTKPAPLSFQPENYAMERRRWELIERPASIHHATTLRAAVQKGAEILGDFNRSIAEDACCVIPRSGSLTLVHPDAIWWMTEEYGRRKGRVRFRLGRVWYDLPLTDPIYLTQLKKLQRGSHSDDELGIPPW
jgi:putative nucleic acid modification protein with dual OB domain